MEEAPAPNKALAPTQSQPHADNNWRTSQVVLYRESAIEEETLRMIDVEKIVEEELEKRYAAEKKATFTN